MNFKEAINKLFHGRYNSGVSDFELEEIAEMFLSVPQSVPHLYRYSATDYNNIRNLELEQLYLTPSDQMNDVFEGLSCEVNDRVLELLDNMKDMAYLKSFSEEKDNLLMWAHYADNYSGMCVEYDLNILNTTAKYHLYPVFYSDNRICNMRLERTMDEMEQLKYANRFMESPSDTQYLLDIMSLFLTKSNVWRYEKEWRIIATYPQIFNSEDDIEYEIGSKMYGLNSRTIDATESIKAVYLGPKVKEKVKEHIIEICNKKAHRVNVYSSMLSKTSYELEFRKEN